MRGCGLAAPGAAPGRNPREQGRGASQAPASIPHSTPGTKAATRAGGKQRRPGPKSGEGGRGSKAPRSPQAGALQAPLPAWGRTGRTHQQTRVDSRSRRQVSAGPRSLICAARAVTLRAGRGDGRRGRVHRRRRGGGRAAGLGEPRSRGPRPLCPPTRAGRAPQVPRGARPPPSPPVRAGSGWGPAWPRAQLRYCCRL